MATIKYRAVLNGELVGKRTSASGRVYTHAVVVDQALGNWRSDKGLHAVAWCGRVDLAAKAAAQASKYFAFVTVVEAEVVPTKAKKAAPSNAATAQALNDSGVFAPFTVRGEDK